MQSEEMIRYPRTEHLEDSRLGQGDDAKGRIKLDSLHGRWIVIEEKVDGANAGISFHEGSMRLQSRGHFLAGGGRERQFSRFKAWADAHEQALFKALGDRYVMYGEWMAARHTCFYDNLPHLFMEFDIYDKDNKFFLSTLERQKIVKDLPVAQVPVLFEGLAPSRMKTIKSMVGPSLCRTPSWRDSLRVAATRAGVDPERALFEAGSDDAMEGLYVKVEQGCQTVDRYKWVRKSFVQAIEESGTHWAERPMILNGLSGQVDLYEPLISWETPGLTGRDGQGGFKAWAQSAPAPATRHEGPGRKSSGGKP
jgi:hypothetical protein